MRALFPISILVLASMLVLAAPVARAIEATELLDDPVLEARARDISKGLRCLVCQNESIDDSDADLARDLRRIVRERLVAGDSNEAVRRFIVARYGDFVLLNPPFKASTYALWLGPLALLLLAGAGTAIHLRRRRAAADPTATPLSDDERRRLANILGDSQGRA